MIGTCGECFYLGVEQSGALKKAGIALHNCDGDARCNSGELIINLFFMGKLMVRVTDPASQGGPYFWPRSKKEKP